MAIVARINNVGNIGRATVKTGTRASVVSPNFAPKPNVALVELTDVSITSPEDGAVLSFDSTTNRYEVKQIDANNFTNFIISTISGGTF